jgi:hypothetical protein
MRKKAEQIFMAETTAILGEIRGLLSATDGRAEKARRIVRLIDVESERVNAFTEEDRDLLENCAEALTALWDQAR